MNTPRDLAVPLERITWRDGQLLTSYDIRDEARNSDRFRHLHIHYLHRTWGVVEGLNVVIVGGLNAVVSPGYALDIQGHELLLPVGAAVAAPAGVTAATTTYMVITGAGSRGTSCRCSETPQVNLTTLCPGAKNSIALEQGELAWKTVTEVRPGIDILLARVLITNGRFASGADTSVQRRAAALAQPRIWSEATAPGQTGWTDGSEGPVQNISATVDTSAAGFVTTPAYFAWLAGTTEVIEGFVSAADMASFTFVLRQMLTVRGKWNAAMANSQGWTVRWFAVELPPA